MSILLIFTLVFGEAVESQNSSWVAPVKAKVCCDPILRVTHMPFSVVFCVVHGGVPREAPMPFVLSRIVHLVLWVTRLSFVFVCSQAHVLRPCRHPFCPLLCRRPQLAETRQRDKLRTVSCLSGSSSSALAYFGRRSHRTPGVLDVLPCQAVGACAGASHSRWSIA